MSTTMTAAGESLVARLQAEGKPLTIDRMIFANVPGQDHTQAIAPGVNVPTAHVVHQYDIPPEYRAYVNPNQVVYSALLGSDVGDFTFNWQGLYCSAHDVLVAVATFPALEKRKYDVATGKVGNNMTRNFLLSFTGAREITNLTISADVWQLDFTVRLLGMDERTRLANFDLYGQGYFEGDGWLLRESGGHYSFTPGLGYVGGIRSLLPEILPLAVTDRSREVWLSVCLKPVGSDRVAEASALLVDVGTKITDAADETGLMHYRQIVARIEANGTVTDLRPKRMQGLPPEKIGSVPVERQIIASTGMAGGGRLDKDVTLIALPDMLWLKTENYRAPCMRLGSDGKVYLWQKASGPAVEGVGAKQPGAEGSEDYWLDYAASLFADMMDYRLCQYDWFEDDMPRAGFFSCLGGVVTNFAATYPKAAAYFNTTYGKKRLVTQAQYDALHVYSWHTKADGTKVGWEGIGGVAKFVWDKAKDTLRLPDLAGMTPEQVGYLDSLGVGAVHGDGIRNITGSKDWLSAAGRDSRGALIWTVQTGVIRNPAGANDLYGSLTVDASRVVPIAATNQIRAWISDARVYLGQPVL